jgi:hypothetical protein
VCGHTRCCVRAGARASGRVYALACMYPCLRSTQRVCAILCRNLWPLSPPHFSTLCHKRCNFRTYFLNIRCVLILSTTFVQNTSHSKQNLARYCHKWKNVFMSNTRYFYRILTKPRFSQQIFKCSLNIKFHQNPSSGSRVVPCGRTDGHDDANSRFSQLYKRA